ncbi:hypothetical protein [Myroides sp. WP-1]|uniref:hypothetical protein n=1 Tax=Myroides sp. WP-1 TaxID=2759944 RepID=UPI0015FA3CBB|nr:hypothetical protein [Myroides sp. WP-1]MBB1140195.1 hypothetical protein [Myroides sp. WP-1]
MINYSSLTLRNLFIAFFFFLVISPSFSQENHTVYVNLGGQGIEASYKYRITYDTHVEAFVGLGPGYQLEEKNGYSLEYGFIPFAKTNLKWHFVNEEERKFYLGMQAKYSFGKVTDESFNKILLTELHIGHEERVTKRLLFNIHAGGGYMQDFDVQRGEFIFTCGVTLKYAILSRK